MIIGVLYLPLPSQHDSLHHDRIWGRVMHTWTGTAGHVRRLKHGVHVAVLPAPLLLQGIRE